MILNICDILKAKLKCENIKLFSDLKASSNILNIINGSFNFNNFDGVENKYYRLCSNLNSDEDCLNMQVGTENIFTYLPFNENFFYTPYKYLNAELRGEFYLYDNLRILNIIDEVQAFEMFKKSPNNYIFIMIDKINYKDFGKGLIQQQINFKVLLYLYEIARFNLNANSFYAIESDILSILYKLKIYPINSDFKWSSDKTIIREINFKYLSDSLEVNNICDSRMFDFEIDINECKPIIDI
jgi:hypothetical protein